MDPRKQAKLEQIFEKLIGLPADHRARMIDEQCSDDHELRRELESLLSAHESAGDFLTPPGADEPGTAAGMMAGPYRLLRRIGEGGMSEVYLASRADDEFKKRVAVKVIRNPSGSDDVIRRFRTERQILAGLDHPNVARLLDGGTLTDGRPFLAMEFIEGVPIDDYCDRERLTIERRLDLFRTVCSAVQFAHKNLIVHRDIKPSNILVGSDGVPKLLDFGIAKLLRPDHFAEDVDLTRTSYRPMTPRWASPEQVRGDTVTTASDVYSLGALLYKLLTGHLPHPESSAKTPTDLARMVLETDPDRPSDSIDRTDTVSNRKGGTDELSAEAVSRSRNLAPAQLKRRLAGDLDNIVLMALRKEPNRRYGTVEQFSEDIRRYLSGLTVVARPDTFGYRFSKFIRRNTIPVAAAVAFVALLAASAVFLAIQTARVSKERDQARVERDRAETTLSLLQRVFEVSDPEQGGSQDLTAREILERGASQVRQELADEPEARASLLSTIGDVTKNLGLYDQSRGLLEEALEIQRGLGGTAEQLARPMHQLGELERRAGNFDAAEPLLTEALSLREQQFGEASSESLETQLALALVSLDRRDANAGDKLQAVIDAHESVGLETSTLATAKNHLAIHHAESGDFASGERLLREVVALRTELFGDNHIGVAEAQGDLGVVLGIQDKLDESKTLLSDSLEKRRRILDEDHPLIAESLNNLGRVHRALEEYEESESYALQSLELHERKFGKRHPRVSTVLLNLSALKREMGDLEESEDYARRSLSIRRDAIEPISYDTGTSLVTLGSVLVDRRKLGEAETTLREGLSVLGQSVGDTHWRTGLGRVQLARCLALRGRSDAAAREAREGLSVMTAALPPEHPRIVSAQTEAIDTFESLGWTDLASSLKEPPTK